MEHVEEAGVHSGDSACALPPQSLSDAVLERLHDYSARIAHELGVVGLINVQYAVKDDEVFVLEANPRASRTVPFVAKATGVPLAQVAVEVMMGVTLAQLRERGVVPRDDAGARVRQRQGGGAALQPLPRRGHAARARDALDGRSHGHRRELRHRFRQGPARPRVRDCPTRVRSSCPSPMRDKVAGVVVAQKLRELGFTLAATVGTAGYLALTRRGRGDPGGQDRRGGPRRRRGVAHRFGRGATW